MKRFLPVFIVLAIVIGLGVWLTSWYLERQKYESTDDAYLKANMLLISPKVPGYVTELLIDDNKVVKKGDLLVKIESRDYQAKVLQAEAAIEEAEGYKKRLLSMKASQQADLGTAHAKIAAAQARLSPYAKDVQRFTALTARGSAPMQMLDTLKAQSRQAAAEVQEQQANLNAKQKQLSTFDVEMTEVEARLKNAQAQLTLAKMDVEYTEVRAPIDGIIGNRGVQLGQLVRPGMTLAHLVANKNIWIDANFKESQLNRMRVGQPVTIKIDAYHDLKLEGKVDSISPASGAEFSILPPENATGNFTKIVQRVPVKIVFNKGTDLSLLKAGFSAEVKVKVQ
jgi:membrane fusion protein (multidrug efflux system)